MLGMLLGLSLGIYEANVVGVIIGKWMGYILIATGGIPLG